MVVARSLRSLGPPYKAPRSAADDLKRRPRPISIEGRTPTGLAFDRGTVWVAHGLLGNVSVVDAHLGDVVRVTPITEKGSYSSAGSVAAGAGAIWAVFGDATLARLERGAAKVTGRATTDTSPAGVAVGYGVRVDREDSPRRPSQRLDPLSLAEVDSINVGSRPSAIATGFGDVWVTSAGADLVQRIDVREQGRSRRSRSVTGRLRSPSVSTRCGSRIPVRGNGLSHRSRDQHGGGDDRGGRSTCGAGRRGEPPLGDRAGTLTEPLLQADGRRDRALGRSTTQRGSTRDETNVTSFRTSIAANGASVLARPASISPYVR